MRIAMIGTGYVGLVSGACFSEFGVDVICVDKDAGKIARLKRRARSRSTSPGWTSWSPSNVKAGRLSFTHRSRRARSRDADAVFIAVGTPVAARRRPCRPDLRLSPPPRRSRARINGYTVVVTKSTVPVGTGREVARDHPQDAGRTAEFDVASNPEFLREGSAIEDFMRPDRVVIGVESERARDGDARALPAALPDRDADRVHQHRDRRADQVRRQRLPGDQDHLHQRDRRPVREGRRRRARRGARHRPRRPHRPQVPASGPGYGGSCFPKDTLALVHTAQEYGAPLRIVETVVEVNDDAQEARWPTQGHRGLRRHRRTARRSPCSA